MSVTPRFVYLNAENAGYDDDEYPYVVRRSPAGISNAYAKWFSDVTPAGMSIQLRKEKILR